MFEGYHSFTVTNGCLADVKRCCNFFPFKSNYCTFCTVIAAYQDAHDVIAIIKNDDNDGFDVRIAGESSHLGPRMYRFVVIAVQ